MNWVNIADMPVVKNILAQAKTSIMEAVGVDVDLYICDSSKIPKREFKKLLQTRVSQAFNISWDDIISQSRKQKTGLMDARHVYMYLARTVLDLGLQEIAEDCNRTDHSTVVAVIKKIKGFYYTKDPVIKIIEKIKQQLPKHDLQTDEDANAGF